MNIAQSISMLLSLGLVHCGSTVAPNDNAMIEVSMAAWTWRDCTGGQSIGASTDLRAFEQRRR